MTALLEVRELGANYGKVQALRDINIEVRSGQIVTVIGPNGAGKTTLLNALVGLLPACGMVRYENSDIGDCITEARVVRGLCLVPERRELFGALRVEDNLLLGAFPRLREGMRKVRADLAEVYQRFPRLQERRRQFASTLSGGERQMLALGRALMAKPRLLMLDEPSLGLAPRIVRDIFHIIAELKRSGVSILLVEQNARAALQIADYGYVLETGEIALQGSAQALANNPRVVQTYLGLSGRSEKAAS
jgi:branched-chain amino acid transport system ATP-binding protein